MFLKASFNSLNVDLTPELLNIKRRVRWLLTVLTNVSTAASRSPVLVRAGWAESSRDIVPGVFTSGTNQFAHVGPPTDEAVAESYTNSYPPRFPEDLLAAQAAAVPADADSLACF